MSASADEAAYAPEGLHRLERAVDGALARIASLERELEAARRQAQGLDRTLAGMTGGELPPSALLDAVRALEAENVELRRRLEAGREGVERLLAKVRFLEEQR